MGKSQIEKLKARREKLAEKGGGGFDTFFVKEGTERYRGLPVGDDEEFAMEVTHFYLGNDIKGVISPASFGEPCAIMEMYNELKAGEEEDKNLAATFKPRKRFVQPNIKYKDIKGKEVDDENGAKLLLLTGGQYQDLIDLFLDDEQGDFTDPRKGYDVKHKRTGKGQFDTEYSVLPCKPTKLPKKYNKVYNIEEMVREIMPTYEQTQQYINQFLGLSDEEDEAPKKKKKKKTSSKSKEEAPKKKKKSKKK